MLLSLPKKQYSLHLINRVKKCRVYQLNIYFGKLNNSGSAISYVVINIVFLCLNSKGGLIYGCFSKKNLKLKRSYTNEMLKKNLKKVYVIKTISIKLFG